MVIDADGIVDYANPSVERLLGYKPEEMIGKHYSGFIFAGDRLFDHSGFVEAIQNPGSILGPAELCFRHKGGSRTRMEGMGKSVLDASGRGTIIINARDITKRKQTEETLKQAEEKYRNIFENTVEGIFQTTPDGRYLTVNPAMARIFGYDSPQEMITRITSIAQQSYVNPEVRETFKQRLEEDGEVKNFEIQHYRKDGSTVWVSINARAVRDSEGAVLYYEGTTEDITERKQAREALRQSEEMVKILSDANPQTMILVDREGIILAGNNTFSGRAGKAIDELIGTCMYDYMPPDVCQNRRLHLQAVLQTREMVNFIDSRDGMVYDNYYYPVFNKGGEVERIAIFAMDITKQNETEEALRLSERKYRKIFENSVLGISQVTLDGRYLSLNPAQAKMYGYDSPEEMIESVKDIGRQVYVRPEERNRFRELIEKNGRADGLEIEQYRKDGSRIWVSVHSQAVYDDKGNILYCEETVEDVTERKRLELQLRQAQKMEAIGTLAGGIAHDFNNILTVMTGYGTLLQMRMDPSDPLRIYVDQILSASQKATSLTQSLLAFSRRQPITLKPVKLNDIVKGTEHLLKRLLTEDVMLKAVLTPDDPTIMADATQIDQILFNLATNARDAMPKGGVLTIETKQAVLGADSVPLQGLIESGIYAILSVSDTGMGMDETTKDQIFDPFFTTKEIGKGTGLGLSTVYGVVRQHNGYITVQSERQAGTTFSIYFPVIKVGVGKEMSATASPKRGKEVILIAEDDREVRRLTKEILTSYGYTVVEAFDGEDALVKFASHPEVNLLILDSVMPKRNGREVYDEVCKAQPHMKVLFTSGYTRDVVLDKGIHAGEIDFISKPLEPNELLQKVREILDRK